MPHPENRPETAGAPHPFIYLQGVCKDYVTDGVPFPALKDIDLEVGAGEFLGVLGKSGAGKTTLLNMISGADSVSKGSVIVGGVDIQRLSETRRARWRGRQIGVIHQSFQLLTALPLMDNVLLPVDFAGDYRPAESARLGYNLLAQMGLAEHVEKTPLQTSGGQQQRVAIARALANDPPILLADEPTGSLDSATAAVILEIFLELARRGKTILMATHDLSLAPIFSRTVTLVDGEISMQAESLPLNPLLDFC